MIIMLTILCLSIFLSNQGGGGCLLEYEYFLAFIRINTVNVKFVLYRNFMMIVESTIECIAESSKPPEPTIFKIFQENFLH